MTDPTEALTVARAELADHLDRVAAFWRPRSWDDCHGGFLTSYGSDGAPTDAGADKMLNTQARMVWGFVMLHDRYGEAADLDRARHGAAWMIRHLWDEPHGGWRWRVGADGSPADDGKLTYGQSFALYAMADLARATGDAAAAGHAVRTFDALRRHAYDPGTGAYAENMRADWRPEPPERAGDVRSLDIHMHLIEAFTSLYLLTRDAAHAEALDEVTELVVTRMIDPEHGCGGNQYGPDLAPRLPVKIPRTWNDDREEGEAPPPQDLTSYGHNLELGWLLVRADEALGRAPNHHEAAVRGLADHALRYGLDREHGGVFRDGPHDGPASVRDKEFWQNAEAMPGLLDAYRVTGDERYAEGFLTVWRFVRDHMLHPEHGEYRTLLTQEGRVLDDALGNPWKVFYHSGRSADEALKRLDAVL